MNISHLNPKKILFSFQEVKNYIDTLISENKKEILITLNTEMFIDSVDDREFKEIIDKSAVVLDSIGMCILYYKKSGIRIEPLNGIELAEKIISMGYKVFILGTREDVLFKAIEKLTRKYPQSNIVGYNDGYFKDSEEVINKINRAKPQVLLVGMGSPKQEKWIYFNMNRLVFNLAIGIGGSIDVWAGVYKRAPIIFRKMGLEWAYRIFTDIKRLPRLLKILRFTLLITTGRL